MGSAHYKLEKILKPLLRIIGSSLIRNYGDLFNKIKTNMKNKLIANLNIKSTDEHYIWQVSIFYEVKKKKIEDKIYLPNSKTICRLTDNIQIHGLAEIGWWNTLQIMVRR